MTASERFKDLFRSLGHDPVIDAVRAISVLMIVAFHVAVGIMQVYSPEQVKDYLLNMPKILQPIFHGEKGVDAFFLVSATVLGIPLFKSLTDFDLKKAWKFYQARFFRIYPLFLVCLILYSIPQWSYFSEYFWSNLLLINNLIKDHRSIIPVGWSLVVEVQYYALLPILLFALKPLSKFWRTASLVGLATCSVAACALILNAHPTLYTRPLTDIFFSVDKSDFSNFFGRYLYESGWARFGPFAIGLLLAHIYVHSKENMTKIFSNTVVTHVLRLLALVFILLPLTLPIHHPHSWYYNAFSTELNFWVLAASRQVFALGLFLLILGCWFAPREFVLYSKLFKLPFWRPISRLSFPIYLLHFPMIAVAAVLIKGTTDIKLIGSFSFLDAVLVFILAFALTILISLPLHIWVERTAIDYFKKKSRTRVHASVD